MPDKQKFITCEEANELVRTVLASKRLGLRPHIEYLGDFVGIKKWPVFSQIPLDDRYFNELWLGYDSGEAAICYDSRIDCIKLSFNGASPEALCSDEDRIEIYQWMAQPSTGFRHLDPSLSIRKRFTCTMDLDTKQMTIQVYKALKAKDMRFRKIEDKIYNVLAAFVNFSGKLCAITR